MTKKQLLNNIKWCNDYLEDVHYPLLAECIVSDDYVCIDNKKGMHVDWFRNTSTITLDCITGKEMMHAASLSDALERINHIALYYTWRVYQNVMEVASKVEIVDASRQA